MAGKRRRIPKYGTVEIKGHTYYRTTITDSEGKLDMNFDYLFRSSYMPV